MLLKSYPLAVTFLRPFQVLRMLAAFALGDDRDPQTR